MKSKDLDFDKELFARRIKYARILAGYGTAEALATAYDETYNQGTEKSILKSLGNYERAQSSPSIERLFQLCNVLGNCDPGYLINLYDKLRYDHQSEGLPLSNEAIKKLRENPELAAHINFILEHYSK